MTDLPDKVTLEWLGRHLVDFRDETRAFAAATEGRFAAVGRELLGLRDDVNVSAAILRRIDHSLEGNIGEIRALYELIADLRKRVEALERAK
jgi:hypothetical protein